MPHLKNPFWSLILSEDQAVVTSLGFDATGASQWCPNLLKTASAAKPAHPIATVCGAQSGYFDSAGAMHLSSSSQGVRHPQTDTSPVEILGIGSSLGDHHLITGDKQIAIQDIHYGNVRETWRLRLNQRKLEWTIEQTWLARTEIEDAFAPGLFFSAHAKWGTATVFQLWDRNTAQDGFYSLEKSFGGTATTRISRSTRVAGGGWAVAKLLSHACPNGDLRATISHHLKKGEVLNFMSLLAHSPWCEPRSKCIREKGETVTLTLVLEPEAAETGAQLAVELHGPLQGDVALNRRFFDTHTNCAILADTHDWRFGNEPSGYVAQFCSYMYSQLAAFGVPAGALGGSVGSKVGRIAPNTPIEDEAKLMNPGRVLAEQIGRTARHLIEQGTAGGGYQNDTSLDILPSFLASFRDLILLTGDRDWAEKHWAGAKRATAIIAQQMAEGRGMISTNRENGNDYWDWISRNGRITSINVLAAVGLRAQAETARWMGDAEENTRATSLADTIQQTFNADFWSEEHGFYADWIDRENSASLLSVCRPPIAIDHRRAGHARQGAPSWSMPFSAAAMNSDQPGKTVSPFRQIYTTPNPIP